MIQDIFPSRLDISYSEQTPQSGDRLLCFDSEGKLFADIAGGKCPEYDAWLDYVN